jgi:PPIC-type PPIASE domain
MLDLNLNYIVKLFASITLSFLCVSSWASDPILATREGVTVALSELETHRFMSSESKRTALRASDTETAKTIDEIINGKHFAKIGTAKFVYSDEEKRYLQYQLDRAPLTAALAIVERRAREKFDPKSMQTLARAKELWLLDETAYLEEARADITVIQFDLSKRAWMETVTIVNAALAELKAGQSFEAVMRRYTDDAGAEKTNGRVAGVVARTMDPTLSKEIFGRLKIGELSAPVPARRGLYILRLDAKYERKKMPFEKALPQILESMLENDARVARLALINELQTVPTTYNQTAFEKLFPTPVRNPMDTIRDYYKQQGIGVSEPTDKGVTPKTTIQ